MKHRKHRPQAALYDLIIAGSLDSGLRDELYFHPSRSAALVDEAIARTKPAVLAFQGHPEQDVLGILNLLVTSMFRPESDHEIVEWKMDCARKLLEAGMDAATPFVFMGGWTSTAHLLAMEACNNFHGPHLRPPNHPFLATEYAALLDLLCEHGMVLNQQLPGGQAYAVESAPLEIALNRGLFVLANEMALRGATWRTSRVGINELAGLPATIKESMRL